MHTRLPATYQAFLAIVLGWLCPVSLRAGELPILYDALDLSLPRLAEVRAALAQGDQRTAAAALRMAIVSRRDPPWPNRLVPPIPPGTREHAWGEAVLSGDLGQISSSAPRLPQPIRWERLEGGSAARMLLYRFDVLNWLDVAYRETGNSRYAREFVDLVSGFAGVNLPFEGEAWQHGNAGARASQWIEHFGTFCESSEVTAEFIGVFLTAILHHVRFLASGGQQFVPGTDQVEDMAALARIALSLPEFKDAPKWLDLAWQRLGDHVQRGTNDDGFFPELSPTHQLNALVAIGAVIRQSLRQNSPLPPGFLDDVRPLFTVFLKLVKPNGSVEPINDSGPEFDVCQRVLEPGALLFPGSSDEFLHVCDLQKRSGTSRPRLGFTSIYLAASGLAAMRSGWGHDAVFGLFCASPRGLRHHRNHLQLTLHSYGTSFVVDPVDLAADVQSHASVPSIPGHSTVRIDGHEPDDVDPVWNEWLSLPMLDVADASHAGYAGLVHRRVVHFVRPTHFVIHDEIRGEGTHRVEQVFRAGAVEVASTQGRTVVLESAHAQLALTPLRPDSGITLRIEQAPIIPQGKPAPVLIYTLTGVPPIILDTLAFPYRSPASETPRFRSLLVSRAETTEPVADVTAFVLSHEGAKYLFVAQYGAVEDVWCVVPAEKESERFRVAARTVVLQWGSSARLSAYQTVQSRRVEANRMLIVQTDAPVSVHWDQRAERVRVDGDQARAIRVYAPGARSLTWNGSPAPFQTEDDYVVARR